MTIDRTDRPETAEYRGIPATIVNSVRAASRRTGVDFAYLMEKAAAESSFKPQAQAATSSARGLYQFIDQTWIDMVKTHGADYGLGSYASAIADGTLDAEGRARLLAYRDDPRLSAAMAAEYTSDNADRLEAELGRKAEPTDLYLAHFLGAGGAVRFLKAMQADESADAATLLPQAAGANRTVFYGKDGQARSLGEIYDYFSGKFSGAAEADAITAEAPRQPDRARGYVRPVPATFTAPPNVSPSAGGTLAMDAILFLASLDPLPKAWQDS
jgi:hypothetical protein